MKLPFKKFGVRKFPFLADHFSSLFYYGVPSYGKDYGNVIFIPAKIIMEHCLPWNVPQ
jgi:hypothetical protein